jgi:hypothetical protein
MNCTTKLYIIVELKVFEINYLTSYVNLWNSLILKYFKWWIFDFMPKLRYWKLM